MKGCVKRGKKVSDWMNEHIGRASIGWKKDGYYDQNGKEIFDDAIRLGVAEYYDYRYEELTGNMSYEKFINRLTDRVFPVA